MQIVYSSRRGSRSIEHLGSAHDDEELEALKARGGSGWRPGSVSSTWAWLPRLRFGQNALTAADRLPPDLRDALALIK